jgi:DNA-binding NarL/FixJ family response regulator
MSEEHDARKRDPSPQPSEPTSGSAPRQLSLPGCEPLRILIVDDHAIVREGLRRVLAEHFPKAVVGEARNAQECLACVRQDLWTIVLLDLSMPGQSGLDALKQIKCSRPETKVLVLTMHPEDQYAVRVLKAGAAGYLTKDTAATVVAQAIEKVLAGGKYLSAAMAEVLCESLAEPKQQAPHEGLSDREFQVFRMIALGRSVKEIAFELSLSSKTISTYRTRVLAKLKLETSAEVIRYALREKLVE